MFHTGRSVVVEIEGLARQCGLIDPRVEQISGLYMLTRRMKRPTTEVLSHPVVYASAHSLEMLGHNVWCRLGREGLLE